MKKYYICDYSEYIKDIFLLIKEDEYSFEGIMLGNLSVHRNEYFITNNYHYPKDKCRKLEMWEVIKYKLEGVLYENDNK